MKQYDLQGNEYNCTIEIPLKKATYEDIQALNIDLQTKLLCKDKEIKRLKEENLLLRASEPISKLQEDYGYKKEVERLNTAFDSLEQIIRYYVMDNFKYDNNTAKYILERLLMFWGKNSDEE